MTWHYIVLALCAVVGVGALVVFIVSSLPCLHNALFDEDYDTKANELGDV